MAIHEGDIKHYTGNDLQKQVHRAIREMATIRIVVPTGINASGEFAGWSQVVLEPQNVPVGEEFGGYWSGKSLFLVAPLAFIEQWVK